MPNKIYGVNDEIVTLNSRAKNKKATKGFFSNYLKMQHDQGLENLLYYSDIVAMQSSVENRSPFMDYRLVDLSFQCGYFLKVFER